MRLICKECKIHITGDLEILKNKSLIDEENGHDYLPSGYYLISDGGYDSKSKGKILINIGDVINSKHHFDSDRLNGCCGLDGLDGINRLCINNHDIGTEYSDCWMSHYVVIEPGAVDVV